MGRTLDLGKISITLADGAWDRKKPYEALTFVYHRGDGFISRHDNIGVEPGTDDTTWYLVVRHGQIPEIRFDQEGNMYADDVLVTTVFRDVVQHAIEAMENDERYAQAEEQRINAEQGRSEAEDERKLKERERQTAENSRVSSEAGRNRAENSRVEAEAARAAAETERNARFNEAIREAVQGIYKGDVGPRGKSAYQIAVDNGYEGTEEEWLASLVGETPEISIGTVTTAEPGTPAAATMAGTPEEPVLNLTIPKGAVGTTPNITIGTVATGAPGTQVVVEITGTAEAPVLNITIPQGIQGNTGSSVEFPYELVNNRTTDDATKGLSAAEGKRLGDDLDQLSQATVEKKETIDIASLPKRSYGISSETLKYTTSTSYKHVIFPVVEGEIYEVKANSTQKTRYVWLVSSATPASGGTPAFLTGYETVYDVTEGTTVIVTVPAGAKYMYFYLGTTDGYPYTPDYIKRISSPMKAEAKKLRAELDRYEKTEVDIANVNVDDLCIADGYQYSEGEHFLVDVTEAEMVSIVGNLTNGTTVYLMSGLNCPNSGSTVGDSRIIRRIDIEKGEEVLVHIPQTALALVVNKTIGTETDTTPASIVLYHSSEEYENDITLNGNQPRVFYAGRFAVTSSALSFIVATRVRNALIKVKAGLTYVITEESNGAPRGYYIASLPHVGEATTKVLEFVQEKPCRFVWTASADGYIIFYINHANPELTVSVTLQNDDALTASVDGNTSDVNELALNAMPFQRLYAGSLTKYNYRIDSTMGLYAASTAYDHCLIPVRPGQLVKVIPATGLNAHIAWYSEMDTPTANGYPPYVEGTGLVIIKAGTKRVLRVPAGTQYMYVYYGDSAGTYWPSYIAVSVDFESLPDIVRQNDYIKTKRLFEQFRWTTRAENNSGAESYLQKPFIMLHFTDMHGRVTAVNRINAYRETFADYIDCTIQTGDLMLTQFSNAIPYGEGAEDNPSRDILGVVGNHDTAVYSGGSYAWHTHQGLDIYNKMFAPYIEYWGVTQPEGAAENGLCYYYKDFTASKIRLIVLDTWYSGADYHTAQKAWFASVLESARLAGLSVILATHMRIKAESALPTSFHQPNASVTNPDSSLVNDDYIPYVTAFKQAGGDFVCWIGGHSHVDAVTKTSEAMGAIINIAPSTANRSENDTSTTIYDTNSTVGIDRKDWRTFDLFNIMAVDVYFKTITLFRVGSEWDKFGRHIETACINYQTGEVIYG